MLDARQTDFAFLGHTHRWRFHRLYLDVSPKALRCIRDELRRHTRRTGLSLDGLIAELNPYIRGARQYFRRVRRRCQCSRKTADYDQLVIGQSGFCPAARRPGLPRSQRCPSAAPVDKNALD